MSYKYPKQRQNTLLLCSFGFRVEITTLNEERQMEGIIRLSLLQFYCPITDINNAAMSKFIRHTRCRTDIQRPPSMLSSAKTAKTNASVIRLNTTPSAFHQLKQATYRSTKNYSYQQPHIINISPVNRLKPKTNRIVGNQFKQQGNNPDKKYTLQKAIAKGAFGVVYKAYSDTQHHLAIKKIPINKSIIKKELTILKKIDHPNLLKLVDHYFTAQQKQQYLHLVTHYYSHNLKTVIQEKMISSQLKPLYLYQILQGLNYLKQRGIMHRDLTPVNILAQTNSHKVVIADFGSAKVDIYQHNNLSYVCARAYRAPQLVFESSQYSTPIDMWGFGCIAVELVTGKTLFSSQSTIEHMLQILKLLGTPTQVEMTEMNPNFSLKEFQMLPKLRKKPLKDSISSSNAAFIDLISKILVYSPSKRLTPSQALQHPYFNCLKNNQFLQQNNLNPKDFRLGDNEKSQILVTPSSIKLERQQKHKRFRTGISIQSQSTTWKSRILRQQAKLQQIGIAKKILF